MEALAFWVVAAGTLGAALSVVLNRSPVASALSLALSFVFLAGLFVTLEAFFLAVVQVIVYAGAVMVLFLFIIMLLDLRAEAARPFPWRLALGALLPVGLLAGVMVRMLAVMPEGGALLRWGEKREPAGAWELGKELFTGHLVPFEATAVLLLIATLGVVVLSGRGGART